MASHTEIKVNDSNWVIRVAGADVRVKILEKTKKASGRGYDFRCKRVGPDGRVTGRNLVRGSGALRRPGTAPKTTGFSSANGTKATPPKARPTPKPKPPRKPRAPRAGPGPAPRPPAAYANPPASAFFSRVQEPGTPGPPSSPFVGGVPAAKLGSLRGRGRAASKPSPARPDAPTPSKTRREIESRLKHAGLTPLVADLVKRLLNSDGTEHGANGVRQICATVVSNHHMNQFGIPFPR